MTRRKVEIDDKNIELIQVYATFDIKDKFRAIAKKQHTTMSEICRSLIKDYVAVHQTSPELKEGV